MLSEDCSLAILLVDHEALVEQLRHHLHLSKPEFVSRDPTQPHALCSGMRGEMTVIKTFGPTPHPRLRTNPTRAGFTLVVE